MKLERILEAGLMGDKMILGFEDFGIIGALLAPLYGTVYMVWRIKFNQENCIYCKKSIKEVNEL